jgi:hypothetical protein
LDLHGSSTTRGYATWSTGMGCSGTIGRTRRRRGAVDIFLADDPLEKLLQGAEVGGDGGRLDPFASVPDERLDVAAMHVAGAPRQDSNLRPTP